MRIKITEKEKEVMVHALLEEHDRIKGAGGSQYDHLSLSGLENLIARFQGDELDPIEIYLYKDHCPNCKVKLCHETTCYCPQCGEEWWGDKVLKRFW